MTNDHDAIGPMGRAFLATQRAQEASGLSAAELAALDLDEYSRLVHGQTPAQAALSAFYAQDDAVTPPDPAATGLSGAPTVDSLPSNSVTPQAGPGPAQGIDVGSMDMEQYGRLRAQLSLGQGSEYGRGITNAPSRSWAEAAAAKSGRSAMVTSGVEEPRKPARVFVNERANPISGRRTFYRGA